ncbi:phage tail sheath C-terminal domain-containing protein [Actinomycetospora lemnae]|uniref:Phage tail sheath C-terminal domain-containing protein n=1 Tax=Actinomycetospora lemnae TaxID=3019891 RepID=A0ABT5SS02_9PSEU|nr:phage tail sheath C-terminal domain-containing protein [Actinomycetospora sp. DW7H6]MDD7965481.1 phage tail sheath C-terminal domain-containing protein [Actinomycetospora sp. DW7H6]
MSSAGLSLGAPGVVWQPARPRKTLRPERLDIAGFVGVAPRGPVDAPVAVTSWSEYQWRFGTPRDAADGLLGHAVHAFFVQGGRRALVLRVSPLPRSPATAADDARAELRLGPVGSPLRIVARDEGAWGNGLEVHCTFDTTVRLVSDHHPAHGPTALVLPEGAVVPPDSLLQLRGAGPGTLRRVVALIEGEHASDRSVAVLDPGPALSRGSVEAALVTATITVEDRAPDLDRREVFTDLGLYPHHPRWAYTVLDTRSRLVSPGRGWADGLRPDTGLGPWTGELVHAGRDRWAAIGPGSFAGDGPVWALPAESDDLDPATPVHGLDRMALETEIGLLAAPDLLVASREPTTTVAVEPRPPGDGCAPPAPRLEMAVPGRVAMLDPGTELAEISRRQHRMVELADRAHRFVALLDVPRDAPTRTITRWRAGFNSSFAAAYHPWLGVVDPFDPTSEVVWVPPCGFAAGIIAERENRLGLPWGPANALAAGAVLAATDVSDADHNTLHRLGVDVFRAERDGFRLTSARTLSTDPDYRQLSVRRLMTMLELALVRQTRWLVFEPNTAPLRAGLTGTVTALLRDLQRAGAFAGATEAESFSVRCDDVLNPPRTQALGRLVAEIRVCPSVPLEHLVLRVTQDADGSTRVEERGSEP